MGKASTLRRKPQRRARRSAKIRLDKPHFDELLASQRALSEVADPARFWPLIEHIEDRCLERLATIRDRNRPHASVADKGFMLAAMIDALGSLDEVVLWARDAGREADHA